MPRVLPTWLLLLVLGATVSSSTSALTESAGRPCELAGVPIPHRQTRYLAGRAHRRQSLLATCDDGRVACFEDTGLADAPAHLDRRRVPCEAATIHRRRQRHLGVAAELLEDRWPQGKVWYRFNTTFAHTPAEQQTILEAMRIYNATDIAVTFHECEPVSLCRGKHINFVKMLDACYSYIGYVGVGQNGQELNLGASCFAGGMGRVIHEIGHALGLYHEHTHPQREVIILSDLDLPVSKANYAKEHEAILKPYDKASIMHYGRDGGLCFPKDEYPLASFCDVEVTSNCVKPTKEHCNTSRDSEIGQRQQLSPGDISTLQVLYGSRDKPGGETPTPLPSTSTPSPSPSPTTPTPTTSTPTPASSPPTPSQPPSPTPSPKPSTSPSPSQSPAPTPTSSSSSSPPVSPSPGPTTPGPSTVTPSPSSWTPSVSPPPSPTTSTPSTTTPTSPSPEPTTPAPTPNTTTPSVSPAPITTSPSPEPTTLAPSPNPTTASPVTQSPPSTTRPAPGPRPYSPIPTQKTPCPPTRRPGDHWPPDTYRPGSLTPGRNNRWADRPDHNGNGRWWQDWDHTRTRNNKRNDDHPPPSNGNNNRRSGGGFSFHGGWGW